MLTIAAFATTTVALKAAWVMKRLINALIFYAYCPLLTVPIYYYYTITIIDWYHTFTGNKGQVVFKVGEYKTLHDTLKALGRVEYLGENTNTTGGLYWSRTLLTESRYGSRPYVPKIIILITDGKPNIDKAGINAEVTLIRSKNIRLICIGITNEVQYMSKN